MKKWFMVLLTLAAIQCNEIDSELADYNAAKAEYDAANYPSAATSFSSFISDYPDSTNLPGAYYYRGRSYFETGVISKASSDFNSAKSDFNYVISTFPQSSYIDNAFYWRGRTYYELGGLNIRTNPAQAGTDFTNARTDFQRVITSYTTSIYVDNSRFYLGMTYYQESNFSAAITEFNTLITSFPASTLLDNGYYYRGISHVGLIKLYSKTATFNLTSAATEYQAALSDLNYILSNFPASVFLDNSQYNLGLAHYYYGSATNAIVDFQNAADAFDLLITAYPTSLLIDNAYYYCGLSHYNMEKISMGLLVPDTVTALAQEGLAIADFNVVLNSFPASKYADNSYYYTGMAYFQFADYNTAITEFGNFITNKPASSFVDNAYYFRGKSYTTLGQLVMPAVNPGAVSLLPVEFNQARNDFQSSEAYQSTMADNAAYYYAMTYFDEHDCTSEIPAMQHVVSAYPNSGWYFTQATSHIAAESAGGLNAAWCWF